MRKTTSGFTIVELSIVIVVVAILAAITVVAYNGVQQRANNTARVSSANTAIKLVNSYIATYGTYPTTAGNSCVGDGFPYRSDLGYATCWGWDSTTPSSRVASFNDTELKKIGSLPKLTTPPVTTPYWQGVGPVWIYNTATTVDGVNRPAMMLYFLDGANKDCQASGPVIRSTASDIWETVTTSPANSSTAGNSTWCYVALNKV